MANGNVECGESVFKAEGRIAERFFADLKQDVDQFCEDEVGVTEGVTSRGEVDIESKASYIDSVAMHLCDYGYGEWIEDMDEQDYLDLLAYCLYLITEGCDERTYTPPVPEPVVPVQPVYVAPESPAPVPWKWTPKIGDEVEIETDAQRPGTSPYSGIFLWSGTISYKDWRPSGEKVTNVVHGARCVIQNVIITNKVQSFPLPATRPRPDMRFRVIDVELKAPNGKTGWDQWIEYGDEVDWHGAKRLSAYCRQAVPGSIPEWKGKFPVPWRWTPKVGDAVYLNSYCFTHGRPHPRPENRGIYLYDRNISELGVESEDHRSIASIEQGDQCTVRSVSIVEGRTQERRGPGVRRRVLDVELETANGVVGWDQWIEYGEESDCPTRDYDNLQWYATPVKPTELYVIDTLPIMIGR